MGMAASTVYSERIDFSDWVTFMAVAPVGWSGGNLGVYVSPVPNTTPIPVYDVDGTVVMLNNNTHLVGGRAYNMPEAKIRPAKHVWLACTSLPSAAATIVVMVK